MSSDLLAEFDSFYKAPQNTQPISRTSNLSSFNAPTSNAQLSQGLGSKKQNEDIWGGMTSFQAPTNAPAAQPAQDDIWGSFEAAEEVKAGPETPDPFRVQAPQDQQEIILDFQATNLVQSKPGIVRKPTLDLFSSNAFDAPVATLSRASQTSAATTTAKLQIPAKDPNVLFDADELSPATEDDDDFGDFETVATPEPAPQPPLPQPNNSLFGATSLQSKPNKPSNLLSISANLNAVTLPYPQAPKSPSFKERNPFAELGIATQQAHEAKKEDKLKSPSPVTAWPTFEPAVPKPAPYADSPAPGNTVDEEWGDFADLPAETPAVESAKIKSGIEADAWAWDEADKASTHHPPSADIAPPTNVPPPSLLLTLFPPLFNLPHSSLFKAVANQPLSLKNRIISDPSTIDFLRAYLLIATVAARIIAGRKLRWKRDNILSQAMKIGPAATGGKSGMKLAGVDKAETTKEDRETSDVVKVWQDQLGRLRSAVAVANSSIHQTVNHLTIPEISEVMQVKCQAGALTAPKPCVVCGLKREERINKVDVHVEDSFGEWWTEHWGHRACKNFWQEHESKLKQR